MNKSATTLKFLWWPVWGGLTFAVITYFIVLQLIEGDVQADKSNEQLSSILGPVSAVLLLISFAVRHLVTRRLLTSSRENSVMTAFPSYIISLSLAETIAIFGLLLGMQGEPIKEYLPFMVVSFVALLLQSPKFIGIEESR